MRELTGVRRGTLGTLSVALRVACCVAVLLSLTSANAGAAEARPRVLLRAEDLAKWQLDHLTTAASPSLADDPSDPRGWERGVFWVGMTALAEHSSEPWVRGAVLAQGRANQWTLGSRLYHADDQVIGQTYLWAAEHSAGSEAIAPLRSNLDRILADPPRVPLAFLSPGEPNGTECLKRWCWSDALFMAPATWLGLSRETGDRRYRDYALSEFWATTNFLYDPAERLYFRAVVFLSFATPMATRYFGAGVMAPSCG